ncbi:MAG: HAMP domain-containing histidine kinase [Clostridia bacterium]|nr:HAMP domain-containing histidine kinase [Clostridia bacterium]
MKHIHTQNRKTEILLDCLRRYKIPAGFFLLDNALNYAIFRLYGLDMEPFGYAFAVSFFVLIVAFAAFLFREKRKADRRFYQCESILTDWNMLPEGESLAERDCRKMVQSLGAENERLAASFAEERKKTEDFYTAWVHQIKTPISVMKLRLGASDHPDRQALREELFRIEQYTAMVLAYQRLGSQSNDLMIQEYPLDGLIREVIRKYASGFISKKLRLEYAGTDLIIVTDKKWFVCILEQLISNALKYTPSGTVSITVSEGVLSVADTGIGIAPEDLPRIFEKGYTGANGRLNDKSSGLGLYLCGEAAALLEIPIAARSRPGEGSCFSLQLSDKTVTKNTCGKV